MSEEKAKGEEKDYKGSVYLSPEKGKKISAFARLRGTRGFSELVRGMFDRPVKFFTGLFTDPDPSLDTLEIFGDLEIVDGKVRIMMTGWSDDEVLSALRGIRLLVSQFEDEVTERGLKEEEEDETSVSV